MNLSQTLNAALQLHQQRDLERAALAYEAILEAYPKHFDALHLLGVVRSQQSRHAEALEKIESALKLNPMSAEAWSNLGLVYGIIGRPREALASFERAFAIRPDDPEMLHNRGVVLRDLDRPEEALASYDQALAIRPEHAPTHFNRANVLRDLMRPDEALASYDRALALKPNDAKALYNRGNVLRGLERLEEALASYDKALSIGPETSEALYNRGNTLHDLKRPEEALASYNKALAINPQYVEALNNRGNALKDLKCFEEALASYNKALAVAPYHAAALVNRGLLQLLIGELSAGWVDYENRWNKRDAAARILVAPFPTWAGEDIHGKRIIVYEEQGLGDVIQFSRYLPLLSSLGANVSFLVRPSMHRLLRTLSPEIRLIDRLTSDAHFDFQCALLSLPSSVGTTLDTIPSHVPYLLQEEPLAIQWRRHIGAHGFKIGVCWQGNSDAKVDAGRSCALKSFQPIATIPGVRLISLQKTHGLDQLSHLPSGMTIDTLGAEFDSGPDAFADTAAVMSSLDLIITTDTSIAHLAGALGRPVWVVLKHVPDWRWLLDRADSPWYPSMSLYRQTTRGDWDSVFARVAADVAKLAMEQTTRVQHLMIPGSPGELFDKITILEIKADRIHDDGKLKNVTHELAVLRELEAQFAAGSADQIRLMAELKQINEKLWDFEDAIRNYERKQDFGAEFVALARSVYASNDRRAAIKKQINLLLDSEIVEEKSYDQEI